jgi:hypothetical protein
MEWPAVKLLDYSTRVEELEQSVNPFAKVVLAHLKTLETRKDMGARRTWKFRLIRELYEQGFSNQDIWHLFRVIDWFMKLPERVQEKLDKDLFEYQKETLCHFMTPSNGRECYE